jgi:hypothetical protein
MLETITTHAGMMPLEGKDAHYLTQPTQLSDDVCGLQVGFDAIGLWERHSR